MRKLLLISSLILLFFSYSCLVNRGGKSSVNELTRDIPTMKYDSLFIVEAGKTEAGNADSGYQYLLYSDMFSIGIPVSIYNILIKLRDKHVGGLNKYILNDFIVFKNEDGIKVASPSCLHCHAQQFNDQLIIGLGNSYSDFSKDIRQLISLAKTAIKLRYGKNSPEWKSSKNIFDVYDALSPVIILETPGPTPAHQIAEIMAAHRDPKTLVFRTDTTYFDVPAIVVPSDVPALWLAKKRKAFTVNAMEQGSLLKHLMSPTILSLRDSTEARKIYNHIKDVWAYLLSLQPPKYPYPIDQPLAAEGKNIFEKNCSSCHGTYGENSSYPNRLIPGKIIGTDSLMWKYYQTYTGYADWFNQSWFANNDPPAYTFPQDGYVPPPLDGVWITAPYFHNGSVPTIEAVLNSDERPQYWKRDFTRTDYDYEKLGWKYSTATKPGKSVYNTRIAGYGNYGHYFGDVLSDHERKAVIEYLKTL